MARLGQLRRLKDDTGEALPTVWQSLADLGFHFRRGHCTLVSAAPNVGKSVFGLNWILAAEAPSLYFELDGDRFTTCTRTIARIGDVTNERAVEAYQRREPWALEILDEVSWADFQYADGPDILELAERVRAFAEIRGEYPHRIVVDNLMDMTGGGEGEGDRLNHNIEELVRLARGTKAHVMVLCHVGKDYNDGDSTVPASGILYQIVKKPQQVLTLNHGRAEDQLWASVVKNRGSASDPTGRNVRAALERDFSRMWIGDR